MDLVILEETPSIARGSRGGNKPTRATRLVGRHLNEAGRAAAEEVVGLVGVQDLDGLLTQKRLPVGAVTWAIEDHLL